MPVYVYTRIQTLTCFLFLSSGARCWTRNNSCLKSLKFAVSSINIPCLSVPGQSPRCCIGKRRKRIAGTCAAWHRGRQNSATRTQCRQNGSRAPPVRSRNGARSHPPGPFLKNRIWRSTPETRFYDGTCRQHLPLRFPSTGWRAPRKNKTGKVEASTQARKRHPLSNAELHCLTSMKFNRSQIRVCVSNVPNFVRAFVCSHQPALENVCRGFYSVENT